MTDVYALEADMRDRVDGEVRFDAGTRGAYSTDASNFRQLPIGVVLPRTPRGGGARRWRLPASTTRRCCPGAAARAWPGSARNSAVVIDWTKYCHRVESVDPRGPDLCRRAGDRARRAQPATRPDRAAVRPGARHPPNCTIGGMIGNNSCGATAQRTGKVVDNIAPAGGAAVRRHPDSGAARPATRSYAEIAGGDDRRAEIYRQLRALRDTYADEIRTPLPGHPTPGLRLQPGLAAARARLRRRRAAGRQRVARWSPCCARSWNWCRCSPSARWSCSASPTSPTAGDAVPSILPYEPIALEGIDHKLIHDEQLKHLQPGRPAETARGQRLADGPVRRATPRDEVDAQAAAPARRAARVRRTTRSVAFLDDPAHEDELWAVREAGLGATAHVPGQPGHLGGLGGLCGRRRSGSATTCAGCAGCTRSSATPARPAPASTGTSARAACTPASRSTSYTADGVAHVPPLPGAGRRPGRRATAARFSGEHGDGQARGELLPQDVRPGARRGVRPAQGDLRPGRPDEPGQGRRARTGSTRTCGSAPTGRPTAPQDTALPATRTTAARFADGREPLRRGGQVPAARHRAGA